MGNTTTELKILELKAELSAVLTEGVTIELVAITKAGGNPAMEYDEGTERELESIEDKAEELRGEIEDLLEETS